MIHADKAIDAITAYKNVMNNIRDIQHEMSLLTRTGSSAPLSIEETLEMGERYNRLKGALEALTSEAGRIWCQYEDFLAASGVTF